MSALSELQAALEKRFETCTFACEYDEIAMCVEPGELLAVALVLKNEYGFSQLLDLAGVDYSQYGLGEWETFSATGSGFSRAVEPVTAGRFQFDEVVGLADGPERRFAVAYHLLSLEGNLRLRLRSYCEDKIYPQIPSVNGIWNSANWYEREAFDLFGIMFSGHPDLRRILTDYGFVGHPMRKDFPLVGRVEMRYDEVQKRVIYEPVSIEPRVLVPRVTREDSRGEG